jgi:hypothetical protein
MNNPWNVLADGGEDDSDNDDSDNVSQEGEDKEGAESGERREAAVLHRKGEEIGVVEGGIDEKVEEEDGDLLDLECPVCLDLFIEPLETACGHCFCRLCLLITTKISVSGRACPLCRQPLAMTNPNTHPVSEKLQQAVVSKLSLEEYQRRRLKATEGLRELREKALQKLPIFFMSPGVQEGDPVALHLFEPRYKILIRRAMEGDKTFVFAGHVPRPGLRATLVRVQQAAFLPDGRALVRGFAMKSVVLGECWVEDDSGGLHYSKIDSWADDPEPQGEGAGAGQAVGPATVAGQGDEGRVEELDEQGLIDGFMGRQGWCSVM